MAGAEAAGEVGELRELLARVDAEWAVGERSALGLEEEARLEAWEAVLARPIAAHQSSFQYPRCQSSSALG